jgi:hypothetical protein
MMAEVMEFGAETAPLHMEITLSHHKRARTRTKLALQLSDLKVVLMPSLRLLTILDPDGEYEFNAPQMRVLLRPYAKEYRRVVLRDQLPADMDVQGALKVYRDFKVLCAAPTWRPVSMSCSCKTNFGHGVCGDTLLFVSLFYPEVKVPKGYVGATMSDL